MEYALRTRATERLALASADVAEKVDERMPEVRRKLHLRAPAYSDAYVQSRTNENGVQLHDTQTSFEELNTEQLARVVNTFMGTGYYKGGYAAP